MSTKAGNLLWNRKRFAIDIVGAGFVDIDTGLQQANQAFGNSSDNEPPLGIVGAAPPAPGTLPASRVQVIPLLPLVSWTGITMSEPWVDSTTGRVMVRFSGTDIHVEAVALFWDPHTLIGPGQADTYNAEIIG